MSKGKKISAFVAATAVMLSTVGYFPVATTYATSTTCQAQAYNLAGNELNNLADGGTYIVHGDATGDLEFNPGWGVNKSVTIDLAGCTLNGQIRVSGGTVTIIDTSADKTGAVTGEGHNTAVRSQYGGNLVITGGTFEKAVNGNNVTISGGAFVASNANFVAQHLAQGYGNFALNDNQIIVEKNLTEADVTAQDIEMSVGEEVDVKTKITTNQTSEVLSYTYAPTSNDYYTVNENGILTANQAGDTTLDVTVKQGNNEIATETINVKITKSLEWVRIKDWSNDDDYTPPAISGPYSGHCMGHRAMTAGETFNISLEFNRDDIEPEEVTIELTGNTAVMDSELPAATIDGMTLTAENVSKYYYDYSTGENGVWINVTATYNGKTVTAHGHLRVEPTIHDIIEGDGAESKGGDLTQKIDADNTKLRYVYICPVDAWSKFVEKYGDDEYEWSDEVWKEYYALEELCDTPVDPNNYEVTHGSTVVTFASAWLNTLELGEYSVYYEFTDGYAMGTFVVSAPKNEVVIAQAETSVTTANTGVMTAPVAEGVRSTLGATIAAAVATTIAAAAVVFAKRKTRK